MGVRKSLLAIAAASVTAMAIPSVSSATDTPSRTVLGGCFVVAFVGFEYLENGNSRWIYRVREIDNGKVECKDLSNWVLALPGCEVKRARPTPWEYIVEDPNTYLTGLKWETADEFAVGRFVFVLEGQPAIGTTQVAAKAGQDIFYGEIAGPVCDKT